jgi:hypothetical protein
MSFFGFGSSKKPSSPTEQLNADTSKLSSPVYDTGRNVDDIVVGLLNALNDTEATVRTLMHKSLTQISEKEPILVLAKSLSFLNKMSKSQKGHRVLVMNMMSECIDQKQDLKLPDDLATGLVFMSVTEIVAEKVCVCVTHSCHVLFTHFCFCPMCNMHSFPCRQLQANGKTLPVNY